MTWIGKSVFITALVFLLGLFMSRMNDLDQRMNQSGHVFDVVDETELKEDAVLFNQLLESGLVYSKDGTFLKWHDTGYLDLPTSQSLPETEKEHYAELLEALHYGAAGMVVRQQIGLWNQAHNLLAVRGSSFSDEASSEWQWTASGLLDFSVKSDVADGNDLKQRKFSTVIKKQPIPEQYGFIHGGVLPSPRFKDWYAVSQTLSGGNVITGTFRPQEGESQPFTIQLIGKNASFFPEPTSLSLRCPKSKSSEPESPCTVDTAEGWVAYYEKVPDDGIVTIKAMPTTPFGLDSISGIEIVKNGFGISEFEWRKSNFKIKPKQDIPILFTQGEDDDKIALSTDKGEPSAFTQDNGLLALVGLNKDYRYSLLGMLARGAKVDGDSGIQLTIKEDYQRLLHSALQTKLNGYRDDGTWSDSNSEAFERRAAAIVMDADTGEILAVSGSPQPQAGITLWDYVSFAIAYPERDPFRVHAWQGLSKHNSPGSTFKPITVLSGSDLLTEDESSTTQDKLRSFIKGYTKRKFSTRTGMNLGCQAYYPMRYKEYLQPESNTETRRESIDFCSRTRDTGGINNHKENGSYTSFEYFFNKGTIFDKKHGRFDLETGVQNSLNAWFIHYAMLVDGKKAAESVYNIKPEFALEKSMLKFGFVPKDSENRTLDLARNHSAFRRISPAEFGDGDILNAHIGTADLINSRQDNWLWMLAQNSMGQGVTASPLQMARVAAVIATEKAVQPTIVLDSKSQDFTKINFDSDLLQKLQAGMHGVVENGTARNAFKKIHESLRKRIHGKTGTAQIGKSINSEKGTIESYNSAWFMGWMEPKNKEDRRLAFSCMITHSQKGGGKACAPVIAEFIKLLDEEQNANVSGPVE